MGMYRVLRLVLVASILPPIARPNSRRAAAIGPTLEERERITAIGNDRTIDEQLDPDSIANRALGEVEEQVERNLAQPRPVPSVSPFTLVLQGSGHSFAPIGLRTPVLETHDELWCAFFLRRSQVHRDLHLRDH